MVLNWFGSEKGLKMKRCFTLPEVIIAVLCTAIVMAAAASLFNLLIYTEDMVTKRTHCLAIAESRLDFLRSISHPELLLANENKVRVNEDGIPDSDGKYLRTTVVTPSEDNLPCCEVSVVVTAPKLLKRPQVNLTLSTVVIDKTQISGLQ